MNKNKIISIVIALAVAVGVLVLAAKLISGAISIESGPYTPVLGINGIKAREGLDESQCL